MLAAVNDDAALPFAVELLLLSAERGPAGGTSLMQALADFCRRPVSSLNLIHRITKAATLTLLTARLAPQLIKVLQCSEPLSADVLILLSR